MVFSVVRRHTFEISVSMPSQGWHLPEASEEVETVNPNATAASVVLINNLQVTRLLSQGCYRSENEQRKNSLSQRKVRELYSG